MVIIYTKLFFNPTAQQYILPTKSSCTHKRFAHFLSDFKNGYDHFSGIRHCRVKHTLTNAPFKVLGKFLPENLHWENSHPSNFSLLNSLPENSHPENSPQQYSNPFLSYYIRLSFSINSWCINRWKYTPHPSG